MYLHPPGYLQTPPRKISYTCLLVHLYTINWPPWFRCMKWIHWVPLEPIAHLWPTFCTCVCHVSLPSLPQSGQSLKLCRMQPVCSVTRYSRSFMPLECAHRALNSLSNLFIFCPSPGSIKVSAIECGSDSTCLCHHTPVQLGRWGKNMN